jgi:hypothetical protein
MQTKRQRSKKHAGQNQMIVDWPAAAGVLMQHVQLGLHVELCSLHQSHSSYARTTSTVHTRFQQGKTPRREPQAASNQTYEV